MQKFITTLLIIGLVLAALGCLCYFGVKFYRFANYKEFLKDIGTCEEYYDTPIRWISVSSEFADVKVMLGNKTGCRMENVYIPGCKLYVEDEKLCIVEKNPETAEISGWKVGDSMSFKDKAKIYIYISEESYENFDLDLGAGNVEIKRVSPKNLVLQIGAGNLKADNILNVENGAVQIAAGNVEIGRLSADNFIFDVGLGNIEAGLSENCDEYDIRVSEGTGRYVINGDSSLLIGKENSRHGKKGRSLKIDCGVGNVELKDAAVK